MKRYFFKFITLFTIVYNVEIAFCIDNNGAWIDIPTTFFALPDECKHKQIGNLIDSYHSIEKKSLSLILKRIYALEKIHKEIVKEKISASLLTKNKLKKLEILVKKKTWYLKEINAVYNNTSPYNNFINIGKIDYSFIPVFLVNDIFFDLKLPAYWGLYWLEALDPCHRFLTPHYIKWKSSKSTVPFFVWLEDQEVFFNITQVNFLPEDEILKHQLYVLNGYFINIINGENINYSDSEKEYLFIVTLDQKIIVIEGSESVRHSSISHGRPVLGAGALKIQNGNLTYIDAESGHYQPKPNALFQVITILNNKGLKLDYNNIMVKYYSDGCVIHENAADFIKKQKEKLHDTHDKNLIKKTEIFVF